MTTAELDQIELMMRRVLPEMIEKALHLNQKPVIGGDFAQKCMQLPQKSNRQLSPS